MRIIQETQSVCPECGSPTRAVYAEQKDGSVWFMSECPNHGLTEALAAEQGEDFRKWISNPVINIPMKTPMTQGEPGTCPLHCGTCDQHLQTACCVILDITQRCNQHCPCCFASAGESSALPDPTLEEIERWYDHLIELGEERPFNIQLSGGEPTVRDDLPEIIRMGRSKGFEYIQINSNGRRIALEDGYAEKLQEAGASVVFMQFDGTKEKYYHALRGEALLEVKKQAISNCAKAGLPVTLVPTLVKGLNLENVGEMIRFMLDNLGVVKGIHFQPVSFIGRHDFNREQQKKERVTMFEVMHQIEKQTKGVFLYEDLCPISTGSSLCCFCGSYLKERDGRIKSLISKKTKAKGLSCCDSSDPLAIIRRDRDFVVNKWEVRPQTSCSCCCQEEPPADEPMDLDQMLSYLASNSFTVSGMAFMDETNLDAERLKRCRVQVYTPDRRLVPFCAHQWHRR